MSQNHVIAFLLLSSLIVFSGRGLSVLEMWFFSSFLWVWKHPWSKVNKYSTNVTFSLHVPFISFILLSFLCSLHFITLPFLFLSFCIFFLYGPSILLSCSFHMAFLSFHFPSLHIKHKALRKVISSNRSVGICPKAHGFIIFRYLFLGWQCIASATRGKPS